MGDELLLRFCYFTTVMYCLPTSRCGWMLRWTKETK
jgi:hypothetical protein